MRSERLLTTRLHVQVLPEEPFFICFIKIINFRFYLLLTGSKLLVFSVIHVLSNSPVDVLASTYLSIIFILFQSFNHFIPVNPTFFTSNPFLKPVKFCLHFDHLVSQIPDSMPSIRIYNEFSRHSQFFQGYV